MLATWHRFPTVTARIAVRFRRPVPINTELTLSSRIQSSRGRRIVVQAELRANGEVLADAAGSFLHVPLEHFLRTPEGRAAGDDWRRRLGAE